MTMRLDIVTNDAGELVRREHARDQGSNALMAVYKLAKLAQVHNLTNQAFLQQLDQTVNIVADYCLRSGTNLNILFAHRAAFVGGQLLKGSRGTYQLATELGEIFEWLGGSELIMQRDISREEMLAFAEEISRCMRSERGNFRSPTAKIRLRQVADAARMRGIDVEKLDQEQRIRRTYASAVVVLRRFFEDLESSHYMLPRRIKRVAQSLVDLSDGTTPAFLGVTEVRNANHDEAGRAVNSAILAVAIAREVTSDRVVLAQVAMAAMMHDVARPRAFALSKANAGEFAAMMTTTTLSEDQEDRLAAGTAAVLTALGRVNEPTITRTVVAYEAQWMRRQQWLGPLYRGQRQPTVHARIMRIARRYNDLLTPEPGLPPPTTDFAVASLDAELTDPSDKTVLRMAVAALGLIPIGTVVQLSTGEVAEVTRGAAGSLDKPKLKIVMDARGGVIANGAEIDLGKPNPREPPRQINRVVSIDGWKKGLEGFPQEEANAGGGSDPPPEPPPPPAPPPVAAWTPPQQAPAPEPPPAEARSALPDPRANRPPIALGVDVSPAPPPVAPPDYSGWSSPSSQKASSANMKTSSANMRPSSGDLKRSSPSIGTTPSRVGQDFARAPAAPAARPPRPAPAARMRPEGVTPTAEGVLSTTPLVHVLVYMLDHALTGTVVFMEGEFEHAVYFVAGVPAKVRLAYGGIKLGEALARLEQLDGAGLDALSAEAKQAGLLFGQHLVANVGMPESVVGLGLELQLLENLATLTNLPVESTYSYFYNVNSLADWGAANIELQGALNAILTATRQWRDRDRIRATLLRISKHPLVFFEECAFESLVLTGEEEAVMALLRTESLTYAELIDRGVADEEVVNSLVYTFAVTRQFAFKGQKKGPMAARAANAAPAPVAAPVAPPVHAAPPVAPRVQPAPPAPPPPPAAPVQSVQSAQPAQPAVRAPLPAGGRRPMIRPIRPAAAEAPAPPPPPPPPPSRENLRHAEPPPDDDDDEKTAIAARPVFAPPRPAPRPQVAASPTAFASRPEQSAPVDLGEVEIEEEGVADAERALGAVTDFRLAEAALKRGDIPSAEVLAEKAVEGDPSQAEYRALLTWVRSQSRPNEALEFVGEFDLIIADDPVCETAHFYRGKLLKALGRQMDALAAFEDVLALNPDHRGASIEVRVLRARR
ncbi:MAG: hypothetical protein IPF92_26450 [Myxococcales bacterium]|nr:hypothetical protein [Myxococcales bacterium]HQY60015.1 hypothetical protein [Polyangiaceae bacterium]